MNDITKLPQWAQREIERLRRDLAQMETDIAMIVGATPSAVEVDPERNYRSKEQPRLFLPATYSVRFNLVGGEVDVRLKDGAVEIYGNSQGSLGDFVVVPQISNVIAVRFEGAKSNV
jgi:hypothetical protein